MHTPERLRATVHLLDWANQPDPFREYEGVPLVDLPSDAPAPVVAMQALLRGELAPATTLTTTEALSTLLFHAAAVSASKVSAVGTRYALRVNPSSGNLHPTEWHFATHGLAGWADGVYHYRASQHVAEQRAVGTLTGDPLRFLLTTIVWREAWKYRARAYRYCLLDAGHAVEALVTSARALGWDFTLNTAFDDDAVAEQFRLPRDEWPLALVTMDVLAEPREPEEMFWRPARTSRLSEAVEYEEIVGVHEATKMARAGSPAGWRGQGPVALPDSLVSNAAFAEVARRRRSALNFVGGEHALALEELAAVLRAAAQFNEYLRLWLFVHRVQGLALGVYRYEQWTDTLTPVKMGDQRVMAAGLCLAQDLAGNAAVTFAIAGNLSDGYRDVHMEAGRLGHRLYLAAEALGWQATGIGAFHDEALAEYLGLESGRETALYCFAVGQAVEDERLSPTPEQASVNLRIHAEKT